MKIVLEFKCVTVLDLGADYSFWIFVIQECVCNYLILNFPFEFVTKLFSSIVMINNSKYKRV